MSWFWAIVFLSFTFITEAKHHQKTLPSAVIVGTVYCDTCFQQDFSKATHFLSGASVAVECKDNTSSPASNFRKEVKTNKHGVFQVHLPVSISKHINKIKSCSVQLIRSNEPLCAIAATATSSNLRLKSRKQGTHIFSSGFFTFKPLYQHEVCGQKTVVKNLRKPEKLSPIDNPNDPTFYPPLQDPRPDSPILGGILPLPELPLLPRLPPIPLLPLDAKNEKLLEDNKVNQPAQLPFPFPNPFNPIPLPPNPLNPPLLPPNPLLPPPSLLPPNPLLPPPSLIPPIIPSPPPSLFPPLFPTPPTPPSLPIPLPPLPGLTPIPPLPGLTPPLPPPAAPTFPIPFPPFPFQPTPGLPGPGVPPAGHSSESKTSSP